jgi:hypothetical protein
MRSSDFPIASAAVQPKIRSAPAFQMDRAFPIGEEHGVCGARDDPRGELLQGEVHAP